MEDIIHLLPDSVANQIAAGEVVQRPASIVKEMMENSIDADATEVQVLITDGGKTCVQIIDNGKGMSETDARMSFERHATSKINKATDLYDLHTMGFRGEALASIAAVAQIDLKTRRAEDELGTHIEIAGSRVERQEPVACAVGSNFSVRNLFYNIPARRKFLKTNQTELNNIVSDFQRIALVYPSISFTLVHNGTEVFKLRSTTLRQRIVDVFGKKINESLLPVEVDTSLVRISGYVATPETSRKKGSNQFFFVNGRYMRHPYFHSAVMHAYENLIPAGEQVSYFLYISVPTDTIDVNVHPTKTEIKFDNEQPIWQVIAAAVKEALGKYSSVPTIDFDTVDRPDIPVVGVGKSVVKLPESNAPAYNPFHSQRPSYKPKSTEWESLYKGIETFERNKDESKPKIDSLVRPEEEFVLDSLINRSQDSQQSSIWNTETDKQEDFKSEFADVAHCPHFQYKGKYIITPSIHGVLVVDQHRAHVRVLYDTYLNKIANHSHVTQGLLFPEIVQFTTKEALCVDNIFSTLESLGFDISNLGGGSYSINGVPNDIEGLNPTTLLHDLVYAALEHGEVISDEVNQAVALAMAQSAAIVYGQVLTDEEIVKLLEQLFQLSTPLRTPDGKIVFTVIEHRNIEKMFN